EPARGALHVPDVRDRRGQLDVAHALAAHLGPRHLDATLVAHGAGVANSLVLAAVALPVLGRTENALAEQAAMLGLERAVVDGFRLDHLAVRPAADRLGRGQPNPDRIEIVHVQHGGLVAPPLEAAAGAVALTGKAITAATVSRDVREVSRFHGSSTRLHGLIA